MAFISASFSNKKLQNRRYTSERTGVTQEAFTSVLDINATEVFTDVRYIPTSSAGIPFSGSSQDNLIVSASYTDPSLAGANDLPILKYWWRHKLKPAGTGTNRDTYFFVRTEPTNVSTDTTGGSQLIQSDQLTNFISPKYISQNNAADSINLADTDGTPGYNIVLFKSTNSNASAISPATDTIDPSTYVFDYKTGIVSFNAAIGVSDWVYATAYQYIGRTLGSQIEDGSLGGSVDYGNGQTSAEFSASIASRVTDLETASGSFSTRVTNLQTASSSFSTRVTNLQTASSSFSTRVTSNTTSISALQTASSSFSTRVTNLKTDSGSFSTRITNLKINSGSFSTRITNLKTDSGSFSTRITNLKTDSGSFSNRIKTLEGTGTIQGVGTTNSVTFAGLTITSNATIDGNLTVNGDVLAISTTNVNIEDAFLRVASGSAGVNVDGGIFIQSGSSANTGSALYHDAGDQRWAVATKMRQSDTNLSSQAYITRSFVVTTTAAAGAPDESDVRYGYGEIYINESNGDIYIRTKTP
jgi:hypothetical protein